MGGYARQSGTSRFSFLQVTLRGHLSDGRACFLGIIRPRSKELQIENAIKYITTVVR